MPLNSLNIMKLFGDLGFKYGQYEYCKSFITSKKSAISKFIILLKNNNNISYESIIDVGANYGQSIRIFKNIFGNNINIYAFEPSLDAVDYLKSVENVRVINCALGDSNTKNTLFTPHYKNFALSGLQTIHKSTIDEWILRQSIFKPSDIDIISTNIDIKPLDDFLEFKSDLIKIDVQGHEYDVLRGGINYLNKFSPDILIELEFEGSKICIEFLEYLGYRFCHKINDFDYFFSKKDLYFF